MDNPTDIAIKILDECRARIQANMAKRYRTSNGERWINASGRSSAAFQVESDNAGIRLVYRGDDVAPLDSIQYGTNEVPTYEQASEWREAKLRSGAPSIPSPDAIIKGIRRRGTERFREPQEWVIAPEVERASEELANALPSAIMSQVTNDLFK